MGIEILDGKHKHLPLMETIRKTKEAMDEKGVSILYLHIKMGVMETKSRHMHRHLPSHICLTAEV